MTKSKLYDCAECGSSFRVLHEMDSTFYSIRHCPFCGDELDVDTLFNVEEDDADY